MFFKDLFKSKIKNKKYEIESDNDSQFKEVEKIIESEIKHFVRSHNGRIRLIAVKDNIVYIELSGSCSNCPAIEITLHGFIQRILKENLNWFIKVVKV